MTATEPRTALEQAVLEGLAQLLNATTRNTAAIGELRGLVLNDVLWSGTVKLDALGVATIDVSAPYAAFGAWTHDDAITVTNGGPGNGAPATGVGVFPIPAGGALVWPMAGSSLTVYGTADDLVTLALFAVPQAPMVAT